MKDIANDLYTDLRDQLNVDKMHTKKYFEGLESANLKLLEG